MGTSGFTISYLICPECGSKNPIPRKDGRRREKGHRKWLYCFKCNKLQNMLEVREGDYEDEWSADRD